ncbi:tRNA (adenine(58)-N(1))-methyltransferase, mitochondrial isoform X1 [Leuresthes tenuis]|uniref:tRNA (adenine(58)-N(1))-methyltransferase, mitochondrial isoform X1 n=1 Tax=Leuresthes tenuis TaxID=355514 RepID=UPI003B50950A
MAVPFRFIFIPRLVTVCTFSTKHNRHRDILVKLTRSERGSRTFSTAFVRCNDGEGDGSDSPRLSSKLTSRQALLSRRRRALSPLERISSLLPQDALSPEVMQLREQNQQEQGEDANIRVSVPHCTQQESGADAVTKDEDLNAQNGTEEPQTSSIHHEGGREWPTLPGESLITFGELLIAEYHKRRRVEFKKMFQLQTGAHLQSSWGIILHDDVAGQPAGHFLKTNRGVPIFIRRASLEDYVLHMKRGPVITYPKDTAAMLMMMDVTQGDCVLESGSGSGAMSLFLSRAVGSTGGVLSVEVRKDHHRRAVLNYERWRASWSLRRGQEWPDNVHFHNTDLCAASSLLAGRGFHAVALDMINPQLVLPTLLPHLHPGAVCAVYLANITQVIDLLEGLRCAALPLLCEHIVEVPTRDWVVAPARQKDGQYWSRKAPTQSEDSNEDDDAHTEEPTPDEDRGPAFGSIPYIARPHPEQKSHTAFLVKLRKCVR